MAAEVTPVTARPPVRSPFSPPAARGERGSEAKSFVARLIS